MSRTFRRNKKYLVRQVVGTWDDHVADQWWVRRRYQGLTLRQSYEKRVARYRRDHHSGHYGVPGWFVRMQFNRPLRREDRRELHRCLRNDEWDDHLPPRMFRAASWYWW